MAEVKIVGKMDNTIDHTFEGTNRVYDKLGLCPTIPTCGGGNIQPKIIEDFYANRPARVYEEVAPTIRAEREGLKVIDLYNESVKDDGICGTLTASGGLGWKNCGSFGVVEKWEKDKQIVAMRGRGENNEQKLELNDTNCTNTLTTVQKDNLVLEQDCKIKKVGQISNDGSQCGTVISEEGLCSTLTAGTHGYANAHIATHYRIRKLTARECWRLMGYCDSDFDKASAVNSQTQLYKQAGNAIIKQVLMGIFSQLINPKEAV